MNLSRQVHGLNAGAKVKGAFHVGSRGEVGSAGGCAQFPLA
jgi:hypothetical protein